MNVLVRVRAYGEYVGACAWVRVGLFKHAYPSCGSVRVHACVCVRAN